MQERIQRMEKIFSPKSVAFIGASKKMSKWGGIVFFNIITGGFKGKLYPVNPKEETIHGLTVYRSVLDIPDKVDLAVLVIPSNIVPDTISECVTKGIQAAIVITAGFAELGDEGKALQDEMIRRARAGNMVLIGPNVQGIAVPGSNFYPWLPSFKPKPGSIGIASQSGGLSTEMSDQLAEYGFGCSKVISAGNCADLSWPDYLAYFRNDPETKVVLFYMEGVRDGQRFFKEVKRTSLKKPVIILKSGRTEAGTRAASSHTGSMAGSDSMFDAACKQAGVIRVKNVKEAVIMAAAFVKTPLPKGRRVCILTGGGGHGVLTADAAAEKGLKLEPISETTIEKLRKHLPPWWSPNNPVDMVAGLGYGGPEEIIPVLMESGEFDGIIYNSIGWVYTMLDTIDAPLTEENAKSNFFKRLLEDNIKLSERLLGFMATYDVPLLVNARTMDLAIRRNYKALLMFLDKNIMLYPTPDDIVNVFAALADRYDFLKAEGVAV